MNQFGPAPTYEQSQNTAPQQPMAEIPAYPVAPEQYQPQPPQQEQYIPQTQEQYTPQAPVQEQYVPQQYVEQQRPVQQVEAHPSLHNASEQHAVPVSRMPEMQTPLEYQTTREGERHYNNPELGQSTFKGGVTSQQLVSKVSGYYSVQSTLVTNPQSGALQQTAQTGNPQSATTWQAAVIFKILQAFWRMLGLI